MGTLALILSHKLDFVEIQNTLGSLVLSLVSYSFSSPFTHTNEHHNLVCEDVIEIKVLGCFMGWMIGLINLPPQQGRIQKNLAHKYDGTTYPGLVFAAPELSFTPSS